MKRITWNKNRQTRLLSAQKIATTVVIVATMLLSFDGCQNSEIEVVRKLNVISAGLSNIDRNIGTVPVTNNNEWNWSQLPGLERVSWRGVVLSHSVAIGFRDADHLSDRDLNAALIEQIELQGNEIFMIDNMLIEGNFDEVQGQSLKSLPELFVVAFTVIPANGYSWNSSQESSVAEIIAGRSKQCEIPERTYLLFASGLIGTIDGRRIATIRNAFDLTKSREITTQQLKSLGVRWCNRTF